MLSSHSGTYSQEGAESYMASNSSVVHPDNFTKLFDLRPISKIVASTESSLELGAQEDMYHYISLKHALMSGGINHLQTGYHHR